jgi:outer membrane biosynthesis protein TonB
LVLPLVCALHVLLALLLVMGLRLPEIVPRTALPMEVTLERQRLRPPEPPPVPRLVKPERAEIAAPEIDIALPPRPVIAAIPRAATTMASGGGSGGRGFGGQGVRVATVPPSVAVPDPNCETLDAYTARVRRAIGRFFEYSEAAKSARIQGEVMVHFFSDPRGRILDSTITASSIERVSPGHREEGRYQNLVMAFNRITAGSWTWQARVHFDPGSDVILGNGIVNAGEDGKLRTPERADGVVTLAIPETVHAAVAQITIPFGSASDLLLLEKSVQHTLKLAQPLPRFPACLKLQTLNAMMPFRFHDEHP